MSGVIIFLYVLATSAALILLKLGSKDGALLQFVDGKLVANFGLLGIMGILLYGISFALYAYLISKFDLGYIIPLTTAMVYTTIFVASFLIFKEVFTLVKVLGIILIVSGLILINLQRT